MSHVFDRTETLTEEFGDGLLIRCTRETKIGNRTAVSVTDYRYEDGLLVEESSDLYRTVYTYENGKLLREEYILNGSPQSRWEYRYTDNTCERTQYDDAGTVIAREISTYDHTGNLIRVEYYDGADEPWQYVSYQYITPEENPFGSRSEGVIFCGESPQADCNWCGGSRSIVRGGVIWYVRSVDAVIGV